MADQRDRVVRALRGGRPPAHDPLGSMAENLGIQSLPTDLDLETATKRLLKALRPGSAAYRRVLNHAAEAVDLYVTVERARDRGGTRKVDAVLREADRTGEVLREWAERMERKGRAVVVRSTDPGVQDPVSCCGECGMPNLLVAAVDASEQAGQEWSLVLVPEGGDEDG